MFSDPDAIPVPVSTVIGTAKIAGHRGSAEGVLQEVASHPGAFPAVNERISFPSLYP